MLGPNDPLNPDIPDPDADMPVVPPTEEPDDDFGEGDTPEAVPAEPGDDAE
jgi:hypothetical protein